jgi:AraC-like DNA-binding protein
MAKFSSMNLNAMELTSFVTWIHLMLLALIVFTYKKGHKLSNLLLGGFLVSNAILPGHFFLIRFHWIPAAAVPFVSIMGRSAYSLLMPFLYLYILSLCDHEFRVKPKHALHGLTYLIIVLFSYLLMYLSSFSAVVQSKAEQMRNLFTYTTIHIQVAVYLVIILWTLKDYRNRLKDYFSSIENINLSWFSILLYGFATMWSINVFQWICAIAGIYLGQANYYLTFTAVLINLIFALTVTYNSIVKSDYLSGIAVPKKYAMSRLRQSDCDSIIQKLTQYMKSERLYLDASLSVKDLAHKIKVPARHISQSLNICLHSNFYDFINRYRIEEIKQRIADNSSQHLTFLALAYEAGFNSKSVFNSAFKKHTGMTPKEYKRQILRSSKLRLN